MQCLHNLKLVVLVSYGTSSYVFVAAVVLEDNDDYKCQNVAQWQ